MTMPVEIEQETGHRGCGGTLVSVEGKALPLLGAVVSGEAEGGLASVVLRQTFANTGKETLEVTYAFPLPADGAVAEYEFRIGERRVVGEIDRRREARERYEKALAEGRTEGLVEQERANLFTQSLGNVPPRQEVLVELRGPAISTARSRPQAISIRRGFIPWSTPGPDSLQPSEQAYHPRRRMWAYPEFSRREAFPAV